MRLAKNRVAFTDLEIATAVGFFPNWHKFRKMGPYKEMTKQIVRSNRIDEFFPGERRTASGFDNDGLKRLAETFDSTTAFIAEFPSVYAHIAARQLQRVIFPERYFVQKPLSKDEIDQLILKAGSFLTRADCIKRNIKLMRVLKQHKLVEQAFPDQNKFRRPAIMKKYNIDKMRELVSKYPSFTDFCRKQRQAYEYIKAHKLEETVYPPNYYKSSLRDQDILNALTTLADSGSLTKTMAEYPQFNKYLKVRSIDPESLVGLPIETTVDLLNSLRTRNKLRLDENDTKKETTCESEPECEY